MKLIISLFAIFLLGSAPHINAQTYNYTCTNYIFMDEDNKVSGQAVHYQVSIRYSGEHIENITTFSTPLHVYTIQDFILSEKKDDGYKLTYNVIDESRIFSKLFVRINVVKNEVSLGFKYADFSRIYYLSKEL